MKSLIPIPIFTFFILLCTMDGYGQVESNESKVVTKLDQLQLFIKSTPYPRSSRGSSQPCYFGDILIGTMAKKYYRVIPKTNFGIHVLLNNNQVGISSQHIDGTYYVSIANPGNYQIIIQRIGKPPFEFNQRIQEAYTRLRVALDDTINTVSYRL